MAAAVSVTRPPVVLVSRAGDSWRTGITDPAPALSSRSLFRLVEELRRTVGDDGAMLVFRTGDDELDGVVRRLHLAQRQAEMADGKVQVLVDQLLSRCGDWSSRDIAVLMGRSHQRVHQLRQQAALS